MEKIAKKCATTGIITRIIMHVIEKICQHRASDESCLTRWILLWAYSDAFDNAKTHYVFDSDCTCLLYFICQFLVLCLCFVSFSGNHALISLQQRNNVERAKIGDFKWKIHTWRATWRSPRRAPWGVMVWPRLNGNKTMSPTLFPHGGRQV